MGRWQAPYFGNLVTQQKHYRRCSDSPVRFVGRQSAKPWTFAVFAVLSPLIDTSQMWVDFAQILPLAMRIRWSLSLIFLDFKCVTMWIWRGWFRWDVHHAVSRDFWRWWQLRHSLPRQSYPACLLRGYHYLIDDVGSSPLLRFPLHWRTQNGQCVIFILSSIFYKGQQGAPIIFPVQSWHEAALRQGRVSLIPKIFQKKMFVPLHFFQAREGWKFFALSLVLQA